MGVPFWRPILEIHMKFVTAILTLALLAGPAAVQAGPPDPEAILAGALEAAGGLEAFRQLGVIEIALSQEETLSSGKQRSSQATAYVDARSLNDLRLDLPGEIVVARNRDLGWATRNGEIDDRPQTGRMAKGTLNQRLFPILLPFSLTMDGVTLSDPVETNFEGEAVWRVAVNFPEHFFVAPSMTTTWYLHVRRSDHQVLGIEFLPPPEVRQVRSEGVRYRTLKRATLGSSIQLPVQLLLDGIDLNGAPTGHVRVTKMRLTIRGLYEPALFLHPMQLEEIEGSMD